MSEKKLWRVSLKTSEHSSVEHRYVIYEDGKRTDLGPIDTPVTLEIIEHNGQFFMEYLDENDVPLTDAWEQSVELLMKRAEHEFGIEQSRWIKLE